MVAPPDCMSSMKPNELLLPLNLLYYMLQRELQTLDVLAPSAQLIRSSVANRAPNLRFGSHVSLNRLNCILSMEL